MKQASFRAGQALILSGVKYQLARISEGDNCLLERASDLMLINRQKIELLRALETGDLSFIDARSGSETRNTSVCKSDLASLSQDKQRTAMRRYQYVKEINIRLGEAPKVDQFDEVITIVAMRLEDKHKPSSITVYRWWKRWRSANWDLTVLADRPRKSGVQRKFRGVVNEEIHRAITDVYLTPEKNTCQAAYDALCHEINLLNKARTRPLTVPSRTTFYRICANYDNYSVMAARKGRRAADRHFRSTGRGVDPQHILERAEIDHTPLDLFVVEDLTGQALGRPTVTFIIDRYSRMPLGFEIGFESPSELVVMAALRHAIMPKTYLESDFSEVENEWPAFGIPSTLVCDNGLEFHSQQLRRMCAELNIALTFCPKKQPHYKGAIERFLGTFNRQISHRVPGTTFSNIRERGDYNAVSNARVTLSDVKKLVHLWLVDIYNQSPNRMTHKPPIALWQQGRLVIEPMLPESREQLALVLASETKRMLNHEGIQINGLLYNSTELAVLRVRSNGSAEVTVRTNADDLSWLWVYDSYNGDYIRVPCLSQEYATKLSLQQHKQIKKLARLSDKALVDEEKLLRAKAKLTSLMQDMSKSKKLSDRKKAAKLNLHNNVSLKSPSTSAGKSEEQKSFNTSPTKGEVIDIPEFELFYHREGRV